ncbi:MAG: hypothetical protein K0R64_1868 [Novosphingobium lindaniclasticum]|uniref:hypothetical protein n=1 Tax=Novosphingobium lindaniclasticum TaxID=1329895 RepID=UPI0024095482|nr:hypothetical protein [Novosphingobium lindaniclasticum]MDF2638884.1 hypothetical protein [Novosphingobium lindaniclasticum]
MRGGLVLVPALMLAACGPSREEERERQLAQTQAAAGQEAAARQQAERAAATARLKANEAELARFYQGGSDGSAAEGDNSANAPQDGEAAELSPQQPGFRADGRPIGDEMPAPR